MREKLDAHTALYRFLANEVGEERVIPVTQPVTLVQNVLYGFEGIKEGNFGIVTEPWHYEKFDKVQRVLKEKEKILEELEFFNIASPDTNYYGFVKKFLSHVKTEMELRSV